MVHLSPRSPMWSSTMTTHVCTPAELLTRDIREEGGDGKIEGEGGRGWREEKEVAVLGEHGVRQRRREVWRCGGEVRGEVRSVRRGGRVMEEGWEETQDEEWTVKRQTLKAVAGDYQWLCASSTVLLLPFLVCKKWQWNWGVNYGTFNLRRYIMEYSP